VRLFHVKRVLVGSAGDMFAHAACVIDKIVHFSLSTPPQSPLAENLKKSILLFTLNHYVSFAPIDTVVKNYDVDDNHHIINISQESSDTTKHTSKRILLPPTYPYKMCSHFEWTYYLSNINSK